VVACRGLQADVGLVAAPAHADVAGEVAAEEDEVEVREGFDGEVGAEFVAVSVVAKGVGESVHGGLFRCAGAFGECVVFHHVFGCVGFSEEGPSVACGE